MDATSTMRVAQARQAAAASWARRSRPILAPSAAARAWQRSTGCSAAFCSGPRAQRRGCLPPPAAAHCSSPLPRPCCPACCRGGGFSVATRISEKKRMQEQVSSHRTGLPDRLLRLFGPRAPLPPYKGPPKRPPKLAYTGIAQVGAVALAAAAGGVWLVLR